MKGFIERQSLLSAPVLIEERGRKSIGTKGQYRLIALYRCHCGKEFIASHYDVNTKRVKCCGCYIQYGYKHGYSKTRLYKTWIDMKKRCYHKEIKNYPNYGGRGITVCDRWRDKEKGFLNFLADMGEKPSPKHSIDRIDVDGDYTPENCRWATYDTQSRNRTTNLHITYKGETKCLKDWCKFFNKCRTTLSTVVLKAGSVERAFDIMYNKIKQNV